MEETDETELKTMLKEATKQTTCASERAGFIMGANWKTDVLLKFVLDEDNHTEGELGNSCIDVQTLVYYLKNK